MSEAQAPALRRSPSVWAAVVCFRPRPGSVAALVAALRPQVDRIVLLDNAPGADPGLPALAGPEVLYLPMPANIGTGAALNRAAGLALEAGAQALVSFDQDSLPAADMVSRLLGTWRRLEASGLPVAAVGPALVDGRTARPTPVVTHVGWRRRSLLPQGSDPIQVDHLLTSGCLVPCEVLRLVGQLREDLFLDYTDIEWSLRARAVGLALFIDPLATMEHCIGDDLVRLGHRLVPRHQPIRGYLQVRNHLLLWRVSGIPRLWLLHDLPRQLSKHVLLTLYGPLRLWRLAWMVRGVVDGLMGRNGPPPGDGG